jgi:hypothetical protein
MKKKWRITIQQNGGEYFGWVTFYAKEVIQIDNTTLSVDGDEMKFDEAIDAIEKVAST